MAISSWDKEVLDNFFKSIASNSSHILFGKPFSFWENPTFQFHAIFCSVDLTEAKGFSKTDSQYLLHRFTKSICEPYMPQELFLIVWHKNK